MNLTVVICASIVSFVSSKELNAKGPSKSTAATKSGDATFYTFWNQNPGSCGAIPANGNIVALSKYYNGNKEACGKCIEVQHGGKKVKLKVTDLCPECSKDAIDLSDKAFDQISHRDKGRINVDWKFVQC